MQAQLNIISVPLFAPQGLPFQAVFQVINTGNVTLNCSGPNPVRIGSQEPQDNSNWGLTRISLPYDLLPGQSVEITETFSSGLKGPLQFAWQMVQERVAWFGNVASTTIYTPLILPLPPNPGDGSIVGQAIINTRPYLTNMGTQSLIWGAPQSGKFAILSASIWQGLDPGNTADMACTVNRQRDNCLIIPSSIDRYAQPSLANVQTFYYPDPGIILVPGDTLIFYFLVNSQTGVTQAQQTLNIWGKYL